MRIIVVATFLSCIHLSVTAAGFAEHMSGLEKRDLSGSRTSESRSRKDQKEPSRVYVRRALGRLSVDVCASSEIYEVYFHIPIAFSEQVPIIVSLDSPQLIDYRFLHLESPNIIVAARMRQALETSLDWEVWVFVRENLYNDLPLEVPLSAVEELPDSISRWLRPTDCVQVQAPIVQNTAGALGEGVTDFLALADTIGLYCYNLPGDLSHYPASFDAVYALNWGSSCTGRAHAGAALFRALGIPARCLLVMPTWAQFWYDMHWIIEIYVPQYGWVKLETTTGQFPCFPMDNIIVLACHPEDEFPLFYPSGIEGYWHSSDPTLGMLNPNWGRAHRVLPYSDFQAASGDIELAFSLTDSVFQLYSQLWGIGLMPVGQEHVHDAVDLQNSALSRLQLDDLAGYIADMRLALQHYRSVSMEPMATVFFDDFESRTAGWIHGGIHDEWELGWPDAGPDGSYSGNHCWGTDLDGEYENGTDSWLMSPPIDLCDQICAYLSFWIWNWVQDEGQGFVYDPLWADITTDGEKFDFLCSYMGGVNDDPFIPDVGGWTKMVLDLTPYAGEMVQIRFHFESDDQEVQYGAYIDDVHVYGRARGETSAGSRNPSPPVADFDLQQNYPNPFNTETVITYHLAQSARVDLAVFNTLGQKVRSLVDGPIQAGECRAVWRGDDENGAQVSSGIYFYRLQAGDLSTAGKLLLLR